MFLRQKFLGRANVSRLFAVIGNNVPVPRYYKLTNLQFSVCYGGPRDACVGRAVQAAIQYILAPEKTSVSAPKGQEVNFYLTTDHGPDDQCHAFYHSSSKSRKVPLK
jgi:hypothetical protein